MTFWSIDRGAGLVFEGNIFLVNGSFSESLSPDSSDFDSFPSSE